MVSATGVTLKVPQKALLSPKSSNSAPHMLQLLKQKLHNTHSISCYSIFQSCFFISCAIFHTVFPSSIPAGEILKAGCEADWLFVRISLESWHSPSPLQDRRHLMKIIYSLLKWFKIDLGLNPSRFPSENGRHNAHGKNKIRIS